MKRYFQYAFIFLCLSTTLRAAEPTILKLSHTNGPNGARHASAMLFSKLADEYTDGRIEVQVFHSGQLANDPKAIELLKLGGLDFTVTTTGSYAPHHTPLNLLFLPYLVDGFEQGWKLYDESPWVARQFEELAGKGVRVLAVWEAGFRQFTTVEPFLHPDDARKQKMRVFPNESLRWMVEAFGYNPVILPSPEVYLALQQGAVIGQENALDTIYSMRFYEVAPHISLTSHIYGPIPFSIAESTWKRLSEEDQEGIRRAAIEAGQYCRQRVLKERPKQLASMTERGATVHRPDLEPFRDKVDEVYDRARIRYGSDVDALLADAEAIRSGKPMTQKRQDNRKRGMVSFFPLSLIGFMAGLSLLVTASVRFSAKMSPPLLPAVDGEGKVLRWVGTAIDWVIVWSGAGIIILMFGNALSRFIFKFDVAWSSELSVFLMVWAIFLGGAAAARRHAHMRVGEFVGLLPSKPRKLANIMAQLAACSMLALLILGGIGIVRANLEQNLVALGWVVGAQYAALPIGAGLALIFTLHDLIGSLRGDADEIAIGDGADAV